MVDRARARATVTAPDVVAAASQDDATAALVSQGFEVSPQQANDLTVPAGTVLSTDPPGGQGLHKGEVVTLVVSSGPRQIEVPVLAGVSEEEATAAIQAAPFTVGDVTRIFDADVPAGVVVSASLPDGGELPASMSETSTIAMVVSLGAIPNVVGLTVDEATAAAKEAGLALDREREDWSDTVAAGVVLTQINPEAPRPPATPSPSSSPRARSRSPSPTSSG